jgi:hypothetical protein
MKFLSALLILCRYYLHISLGSDNEVWDIAYFGILHGCQRRRSIPKVNLFPELSLQIRIQFENHDSNLSGEYAIFKNARLSIQQIMYSWCICNPLRRYLHPEIHCLEQLHEPNHPQYLGIPNVPEKY